MTPNPPTNQSMSSRQKVVDDFYEKLEEHEAKKLREGEVVGRRLSASAKRIMNINKTLFTHESYTR